VSWGEWERDHPWLEHSPLPPQSVHGRADAEQVARSPTMEAARTRIRAAGGSWRELRIWLAARYRDPDLILEAYQSTLTEAAK